MPARLAALLLLLALPTLVRAEIHVAQGLLAGEVTTDSVLLQTRLTAQLGPELDADGDLPGAAGVVCFECSTDPDFWSKDDHDFRFNDADLGGARLPAAITGIGLFREQMPVHPAGDLNSPSFRTHRIHRHVQLWFLEGRDHRSPNGQPDGPDKTLWGREQREWLQRTLKACDAPWKILITPTSMVVPDRNSKNDNHVNLRGYRHEADAFFAWLRDEGISNVLTFCGDRHWQYHSLHPLGVEEFSVGALNDENAIRGEKPGGKNTTDPEGHIRQPYLYPKPTGGFLHVRTSTGTQGRAKLEIEFRDDHGEVLYRVLKRAD